MEVPPALSRLAQLQDGVVTREQVTGLGLSRHALARLTRDGHWRWLATGLYYTASVDPNWSALAWGGAILGASRAILGPSSSAYLHRLAADPPATIDVLVPSDHRVRVTGPWMFVRESASGRSRRSIGSPPRLTAEQTVIDLTARRPSDEVVALITRAVQMRLTTPDRLLTELGRRARHPHRALMMGMLAEVAAGAESVLEVDDSCKTWNDRTDCRSGAVRSPGSGCPTAPTLAMTHSLSSSNSTAGTVMSESGVSGTCAGTTDSRRAT